MNARELNKKLCKIMETHNVTTSNFTIITNSEICHDLVYWIANTVGGEFNLNFLIGDVDDVDNCVSEMLILIDDVIDKLKENNRKVIEKCDFTLEPV